MRRGRWRSEVAWASPQLLLGAFLVVLAAAYALSGRPPANVGPPPAVAVDPGAAPMRQVEVRYVVVDALGLERPGFEDAALPAAAAADPSAQLEAALTALRRDLLASGLWPEAIPAAAGYVVDLDRRRIAIVDVPAAPSDLRIDVAAELAVLRSLVATARLAVAAAEVRVTVGGEERASLWGRVAIGAE